MDNIQKLIQMRFNNQSGEGPRGSEFKLTYHHLILAQIYSWQPFILMNENSCEWKQKKIIKFMLFLHFYLIWYKHILLCKHNWIGQQA